MTTRFRRLLPRREDYRGERWRPRADILAGTTVAIVAMPLALGFGVTSGMGAGAGLVTAVVAGIVAAVFGGSDVQVSGPTGAMTVVLVPIVARYGVDAVIIVGLVAGLILLVAAAARLGRFVAFIPWPVVEGFTVGIAIIIFLQQVPYALGIAKPPGENAAAVAARALVAVSHVSPAAISIAVGVILVMLLLPKLGRALPVSLIAVAVGTAVARVFHLRIARVGAIPSTFAAPHLPNIAGSALQRLVAPALAVAALAAIESLLSAKVADGMTDGRAHDSDRELFGQGLANVASSAFGGMPATGAIARTAVNVRAGARSRLAAAVHGLVLIAVMLFLGAFVQEVPLAALAGVLMATAIHMVDAKAVRLLLRSTRGDAVVLLLTVAATIVFDLVVAIEVGVVVAGALALSSVASTMSFEAERVTSDAVSVNDEEQLLHDHIVTYRLDGSLFFGAAQRFLAELAAVADVRVVVLRLAQLQVLDATGAKSLGHIAHELESRGITVLIAGARPAHVRLMSAVGAFQRLATEEHAFAGLDEAVAHARVHASRVVDHVAG